MYLPFLRKRRLVPEDESVYRTHASAAIIRTIRTNQARTESKKGSEVRE